MRFQVKFVEDICLAGMGCHEENSYICGHETRNTDLLLPVVVWFLPPREQERFGFAARGIPTYRTT